MSRTLKLIVYAAIVWMTLVALAYVAWRRGLFPGLSAPLHEVRPFAIIVSSPVWFGLTVAFARRRLGSERPRISDSHRRFIAGVLKVGAAFMVSLQGFYAYVAVTGAEIDRMLLLRVAFVFSGLFLAANGNAFAKVDPPSGHGAPAPGVWTRTLLRFGWITVALGLAEVVGAVTLPPPQVLPVLAPVAVLTIGAGVMMELAYRRMTRPARAA